MHKKYRVTLTAEERTLLQDLITVGKGAARTLTHARILLKADESPDGPAWTDEAIRAALDVSIPTIARVRERFVEASLEAALFRRPASSAPPRRLDGAQEAHLIALNCSPPPSGHARWTLRLLQDKMVELEYVETVSHETIRQTLKKTNSNPG